MNEIYLELLTEERIDPTARTQTESQITKSVHCERLNIQLPTAFSWIPFACWLVYENGRMTVTWRISLKNSIKKLRWLLEIYVRAFYWLWISVKLWIYEQICREIRVELWTTYFRFKVYIIHLGLDLLFKLFTTTEKPMR